MACSVERRKAIKESARKEYSRLKDLLDQGYTEDIQNGIPDIEAAMKNMAEIEAGKVENVVDTGELVHPETIAELNYNNPKVGKRPVEILSGIKYEDGRVVYKVKFPNREKTYDMNSARMSADQMDPTAAGRYGSEPNKDIKITEDHEKLKSRIWEDQEAAMDLFDELAELDPDLDPEHKQDLRELLEKITDPQKKILNEMKVYLNRKADESGGVAKIYEDKGTMILDIAPGGTAEGRLSAAEVYVHEMVHMSVEMAKQYKKGPLAGVISDMHKLYEQAASEVKIADLVENNDWKQAEMLWDYMFNNQDGISEFIAYGLTHKKLKDKLATIEVNDKEVDKANTVLGRLVNLVIDLWHKIRDTINYKDKEAFADARLAALVANMWEHNNQTIDKASRFAKIRNWTEQKREVVDQKLVELGKKSVGILSAGVDKFEAATEGTAVGDTVKIVNKLAAQINPFTDEKTTAAIAAVAREFELLLDGNMVGEWLFSQEGGLQKKLNYLRKDDKQETWIEKLSLIAKGIDRHRENLIAEVGGDILGKLGKLKKREEVALTEVLVDLDMRVLFGEYKYEDILEMVKDDSKVSEAIDKETKKLRNMVTSDSVFNYYKSQTMGLGSYLATHISGSSVNRSAKHIATMYGTEFNTLAINDPKVSKNLAEVIKSIDRLATLEGLNRSNPASRATTAEIMSSKRKGVEAIVTYHNIQTAMNAAYKRENGVYIPTVKGEVKDLKAGWVEYTVAPNTDESKKMMRKRGYRYKGDSGVKGMGMYVSMAQGISAFDKGAVTKINPDKEMHNIIGATNTVWEDKVAGLKSGKAKVAVTARKSAEEIARQMKEPKMPVMDGLIRMPVGKTSKNFGISVGKEAYADAVSQDRRVGVLLAKMMGEVQEKKEGMEHNKLVLKEIYKDMDVNYRRSEGERGRINHREYIEIGKDAKTVGKTATEYSRRVWDDMPQNIKDEINSRPMGKRYIAVRRDMASMYFGRRSPSVLQMRLPFTKNTSISSALGDRGMDYLNEYMKLVGDLWQEMVKILKIDVALKTPKVLMDNIMSNLYLQSVLGQMPWEAVTGQMKMFKATKEYLRLEREKLGLEAKIRGKTADKADKARLNRVKAEMSDSPVYDTMRAGLFTGIVDELNLDGLQSQSRYDVLAEKYTGWIPQIVKDAGSMLYINKDTWVFKTLMMVLQYSDFVMRSSRYHYLVSNGTPKDMALKMITDEAVNYDRDLGGDMAWVEKMGFWWFFRYFFGSNKNMIEKLQSRPSALIMLEASTVPNPTDAALWNKNFGYTMFGPEDLVVGETTDYLTSPALLRMLGIVSD